jgi:hypothetical protein
MSPAQQSSVFVVAVRNAAGDAAVQRWLASHGPAEVRWFAPRDVDEVERALVATPGATVLFGSADELLDAAWDGRLHPDAWRHVPFAFADDASPLAPDAARAVLERWTAWRRRAQRRRNVAGLVLSLIAVASAFVVFWLAGK